MLLYYILLVALIATAYINKSKMLAVYITLITICDLSGWLRANFTHYEKPYTGTGFILFSITTVLYLAIPAITCLFSYFSFSKKINRSAIIGWVLASLTVLIAYPTLRGQNLLTFFYSYYLVYGIANLIYLISQYKNRFTFSQGGLLLATLGSIICILIAIKEVSVLTLQYWMLIVYCNYIFYIGLIVASWINRFVKKLLP